MKNWGCSTHTSAIHASCFGLIDFTIPYTIFMHPMEKSHTSVSYQLTKDLPYAICNCEIIEGREKEGVLWLFRCTSRLAQQSQRF